MRTMPAATALMIALCLSACGRGGAGGRGFLENGPGDADFAQAIQTRHPEHPIVAAKLDRCQEQTIDGQAAQACGFCFVAVGLTYSDDTLTRGAYLRAVRRTGNIVFTRAPPAAQPSAEAEAERSRSQVWLASSVRHDASIESAQLSEDMMRRAGHRRRAGLGTWVRWMFQSPTSLGPLGKVADPVAASFASDASLRSEAADLVGACARDGEHWRGRSTAVSNGRSA